MLKIETCIAYFRGDSFPNHSRKFKYKPESAEAEASAARPIKSGTCHFPAKK
jgi:hypothetical protein